LKVASEELVFAALGGVGEIGMNLALYGYGRGNHRRWLAVDMGVAFGHEEVLPGVDAVLPDIRFLAERRAQLDGILITHGHEDHYGALMDFWPKVQAPVFMTAFAAALFEAKRSGEQNAPKFPIRVVRPRQPFTVGPFGIEYVSVSHSIPESNAVAIRTPLGTVFHTGDWKLDQLPGVGPSTDSDRLASLGEEGVLAVISDSTNAIRDGVSPSEGEVAKVLERFIAEAPYRVAVTTFASNVARIHAVASAAQRAGRDVVVVGRAMQRTIDVARELGYLDGLPEFLDRETYAQLPRNKVVALMTGSQGEPRATLARIAAKDPRALPLAPGDRVIFSSRTIPGNERAVNSIINALVDMGTEVVTDRDALVHTSGHPRRDELRQLYDWTKPQIVIPVHGEALHLHEQAKLARLAGVGQVLEVRNGHLIRLAPGRAERIDSIESGKLYRDGKLVVAPEASGVIDRRRLSFAGLVSVSIVLSDDGDVLEDPTVALVGVPEVDADGTAFREIAQDAVDDALDALPRARRRDAEVVRESVRRAVRGGIEAAWGKKPQTIVHVTHVSD
jgi:ribonuclease J